MKKIRTIYGLSSLLALLFGICIYLFFRDLSNIIFFNWLPYFEFTKTVFIKLPQSILSYIFLYNIPDMLWFVSGILLLRFIWFYKFREQKIYIISFYIIGALFEFGQLFIIPGTFDFLDLFFMALGAFIEGLIYFKFVKEYIQYQ